jgi:hypothetical protein
MAAHTKCLLTSQTRGRYQLVGQAMLVYSAGIGMIQFSTISFRITCGIADGITDATTPVLCMSANKL